MTNPRFTEYIKGLPLEQVTRNCPLHLELYDVKYRIPDLGAIRKAIADSGIFFGGVREAAMIIEERLNQLDAQHGVTR